MTARDVRERRLAPRSASAAALAVLATVLAATGHRGGAGLAAAALVTGASLLLEVDLPWGGRVSLGHAVVIAVAVLARPLDAALVVGGALVVALPVRLLAPGAPPRRAGAHLVSLVLASAAACGADALADLFGGSHHPIVTVAHTAVAGVAFLSVDLAGRGTRLAAPGQRVRLAQAWPLEVSLLCEAALLALAYEKSVTVAPIAAVPLVVTQFSFQRYSRARATFEQTTTALGLLPEVAGLTPLGHGQRTAFYAFRLATDLGLEPAEVDRVATAARLHHIGYISLHDPEERSGPTDTREVARVGADLLRETGFLGDLADLVERSQLDASRGGRLDVAVIRVCSTLDDLAESGAVIDPFLATLHSHPDGVERTAAIALLRLHDRRPSLVDEARAACSALSTAAGDSGHPATHAGATAARRLSHPAAR